MAPIDTHNTALYTLEYTSAGQEHGMMWRMGETYGDEDAITIASSFIDLLLPQMYSTDRILTLTRRARNSPYTFAIAQYGTAGTASGSVGPGQQTQYYSWTGRSDGGRDGRLTFFTGLTPESALYRIGLASSTFVANIHALLSLRSNGICFIDGLQGTWNPYANIGYNAYWQREARTS